MGNQMFFQVVCDEHEFVMVSTTTNTSDEVVSWQQCRKCGIVKDRQYNQFVLEVRPVGRYWCWWIFTYDVPSTVLASCVDECETAEEAVNEMIQTASSLLKTQLNKLTSDGTDQVCGLGGSIQ